MKYPRITFCRLMFWVTIPLAFFLEYGEHLLHVSDTANLIFQVTILAIVIQWVLFWNNRLEFLEMEVSSREWDETHRIMGSNNEKQS
jgi:hypothetical protein